MKTHFTSAEIAHIWAHKSAPHGEAPSAMSFNSDGFYSYGTVIARHITHKGQPAVILNDTSYSVTTSKHQGRIRQAVSGRTFHIGGLGMGEDLRQIGGKELFAYAIEQAARASKKLEKARNKDRYEADISRWLTEAQSVNEFFGLRRKVDTETINRLKVSTARAERKAKIAHEKRELAMRQEQEAGYENWKDSLDAIYFNPNLFPVSFRVEGEELVSTLGARVPLHDARVAYRFATSKRAQGWHRNGETCPVGNYSLDAINEQGIVAGCHRITWDEITRLAPVLA